MLENLREILTTTGVISIAITVCISDGLYWLYAVRRDLNGSWTAGVEEIGFHTSGSVAHALAVNSQNNLFIAAGLEGGGIEVRRWREATAPWGQAGAWQDVDGSFQPESYCGFDLAIDAEDNLQIIRCHDVEGNISVTLGETPLSERYTSARYPSPTVAIGPDGRPMAAWEEGDDLHGAMKVPTTIKSVS